MLNKNFYRTLGLANQAKKVSFGDKVLESIRNHSAKLVIMASDTAGNSRKKITDKCAFYNVELVEVDDSSLLSEVFNKNVVKIVSVNDAGFVSSLKKYIEGGK